MHNSKLIETIKLFSAEELLQLKLFLSSPYFIVERNHQELVNLFDHLMRFNSDWTVDDLKKEKVYSILYPTGAKVKGKMDKLMSALLHEIHRFILQHFNEDRKDGFKSYLNLSTFFSERKATKFSDHYLEKARKKLDRAVLEDGDLLYDRYLLAEEDIKKSLVQARNVQTFDFQGALKPLDAYYLFQKLEQACSLLSYHQFRRHINVEPLAQFIVETKPLFAAQGMLEIPLIRLYYQAFELLNEQGLAKDGYRRFKAMMADHNCQMSPETMKTFAGLARNFIIRDYNEGSLELLPEIFALHKEHLEKGYLYFEGGLIAGRLKNLVTLGVSAREYDWVFAFLEKYKNRIKGISTPMDVYHFNLAYYYFAIKNYEKAAELLADKYEDVFYKISAKRLEIKIYYETQSEILDAKIDAFKIYIYRIPDVEILDYKRLSNNHFVDFLRQIRNPKTATSAARFAKLKEKIKDCQHLSERDWLLEKLEKLKI